MQVQTKEFLRNKFRDYYDSASIQLPPQLERREWGLIFFDESYPDIVMHRHKSFVSEGELVDYVRSMVPAHVFHSSAYYSNPAAPTMKEKKWQGADLIFDLDADHLNIKWTTYSDMLQKVKDETIKLIDFLLSDFGFGEDCLQVVFSGGRGYHIHVRDPKVIGLGSPERREIVDYITATGLELENFLYYKEVTGDAGETGRRKTVKSLRIKSGGSGWWLRLHKALVRFWDDISHTNDDKALEEIKKVGGIGEKRARMLLKVVRDKPSLKRLKEGNLDQIANFPESFWKEIVEREKIKLLGRPDEPVTADTKRLIRLPTSLHGGSGFQVMPLALDALDDFNPLTDAIVFGDEKVGVNVIKASNVEMKGEAYKIAEGKQSLPEHLAIFLMCRGAAEYEP